MNYKELQIELIDGSYQKHIVIELGDGATKSFPADESNSEYLAFLKQLEAESAE